MSVIMVLGSVVFGVLFIFMSVITLLIVIAAFLPVKKYRSVTPSISVIIPAYNEEANIKACLESVIASPYSGTKNIFVVDDGSTDNTASLAKSFSGVKVIVTDHLGKVDALNAALDKVKTEVVVTIDADTVVSEEFFSEIVKPFSDSKVGAVSGPALVGNTSTMLTTFQKLEYCYNNLVRGAFSRLFNHDVWFFGCLAAFRTSALRTVGGFSRKTMTEDMDIVTTLRRHNFKTVHVKSAKGYTVAPTSVLGLFKQRARWWGGGYQVIANNKEVFAQKNNGIFRFIFLHHAWWGLYALISVPFIVYQVFFWLPEPASVIGVSSYLFRWFTLLGPVWVIFKIPEGWLSIYNIFGVSAGLLNAVILYGAALAYNQRFKVRDYLAIFFYFPYTILLNLCVAVGFYKSLRPSTAYFKK